MDIIVNKDGSIKTNVSGTPVEGGIPADAAMVLTDPAQGNAIVYDGDKWVCGEGGSGGVAMLMLYSVPGEDSVSHLEDADGNNVIPAETFLTRLCICRITEEDAVGYYPLTMFIDEGESGYEVFFSGFAFRSSDGETWYDSEEA